jgi:hypothetical protein
LIIMVRLLAKVSVDPKIRFRPSSPKQNPGQPKRTGSEWNLEPQFFGAGLSSCLVNLLPDAGPCVLAVSIWAISSFYSSEIQLYRLMRIFCSGADHEGAGKANQQWYPISVGSAKMEFRGSRTAGNQG